MYASRREFLKRISGGALALGAVPLLAACKGLVRFDLSANEKDGPELSGLDHASADILFHASLAPSGHNAQPWTVTVAGPLRWIIGSSRERWLPGVDPENRELMLSIGAFLENLITAAGYYGYAVSYTLIASKATDQDLLEVEFAKSIDTRFPLEKIQQRRTVRTGLLTRELGSADVTILSKAFGDRLYYFPRDSREGKYLRESVFEANRIQAYRDAAQEELADWIRWKDEDAWKYRNGLSPEAMELTGLVGWYVRHFLDRSGVLKKSFREQGLKLIRGQVKECGGWLVAVSSDSGLPALVETGRRFERMFLLARERMLAIHPMTQMLEESPIKMQAAGELGVTGDIQFILRTGYLKSYPDPVSLRMPLSRFVKLSFKT